MISEVELVRLIPPQAKRHLIEYLEGLRAKELEKLAITADETQVRRAQGAATALKHLVKLFTESEVR